jgi:hypothetical protein
MYHDMRSAYVKEEQMKAHMEGYRRGCSDGMEWQRARGMRGLLELQLAHVKGELELVRVKGELRDMDRVGRA